MARQNVGEGIIEILTKEKIGATISRLAYLLNVSRPTIYKYLDVLKSENRVEEIDVGGTKYWSLHSSNTLINRSFVIPFRLLIDLLLKTIDTQTNSTINWIKIGIEMSNQIKLEDLLETDVFFDILIAEKIEPWNLEKDVQKSKESHTAINIKELLRKLKPFFDALLRTVFSFIDDCKIEPAIEIDDPPMLIFRLINIIKEHQLLDVIFAIIEQKLNEFFKVLSLNFSYNIISEQKIVDIKIKILHC